MFCCSTPLQLAEKKGHTEVIGLLSRLQEKGESLLAAAKNGDYTKIIEGPKFWNTSASLLATRVRLHSCECIEPAVSA